MGRQRPRWHGRCDSRIAGGVCWRRFGLIADCARMRKEARRASRRPTAECFERWHPDRQALKRVVPAARLRRNAQTSGLLGFRRNGGGPHPSLRPMSEPRAASIGWWWRVGSRRSRRQPGLRREPTDFRGSDGWSGGHRTPQAYRAPFLALPEPPPGASVLSIEWHRAPTARGFEARRSPRIQEGAPKAPPARSSAICAGS